MGAPLDIDWSLAQSLIMQGFSCGQTADKLGVSRDAVRARARRKGWLDTRAETAKVMQQSAGLGFQSLTPLNKDIAQASARARATLAQEIVDSTNTLADTPRTKGLDAQAKRASIISTIAGAAKTVFAWSDGTEPAVRISVLAQVTTSPAPSSTPTHQVIDVQPASTPALEDSSPATQ